MNKKPYFIVTEHYLRIDNPPHSCSIFHAATLDKNDPQLQVIAEQVHMAIEDLIDLLKFYFKYFPRS
jgi:hypothetical protein